MQVVAGSFATVEVMPFDPTYEIDDDTISIGDLVRVPGSASDFIKDGETGTVIALGSPYTGPCKRVTRPPEKAQAGGEARIASPPPHGHPPPRHLTGAGRPNSVSLSADTSRLADGGRTARRCSLSSRLAARTGYCQQKLPR